MHHTDQKLQGSLIGDLSIECNKGRTIASIFATTLTISYFELVFWIIKSMKIIHLINCGFFCQYK
jgi:hypothetical protein